MFRQFGGRDVEPAPVVFDAMPAQAELIAQINANAARVRQLETNVTLAVDGLPRIKGSLQLERPDRIRIKAGLMGISELGVDVGSNSELFWVWSKAAMQGQSPAIYFASHDDYRSNLHRSALPLEPQWIIDAMGLVEFTENDTHRGPYPADGGRWKLVSTRQTPAGPMTRVSIIEPKSATILQQAIYNSSNRRVAYSNSSRYRYYADEQVSLPHWIDLHLFDPEGREIKVTVEAGDYKINALYGDPDQMWTMPNPAGIPRVDLTQVSN